MNQQHQAEISTQIETLLDSICAGPLPVAGRLELRRLADALCHASKVMNEPLPNTTRLDAAVAALKQAHPYEELAYEVFRLEDF